MSVDMDRIKQKLRGLLNIARDDSAASGEIDNAMALAAKLMNEHHLSEADIDATAQEERCDRSQPMGTADCDMTSSNFTTWEFALANAVRTLVGSVQCYRDQAMKKKGAFGKNMEVKFIRFYGIAEDAQLAADMMSEWAQVISTMAVGKYGGCYRGDGAKYALGFAHQLGRRAAEAANARKMISNASTSAIVHVKGGTLAQVLEKKKELAVNWLKNEKKIKLNKRGGRGTGTYSAGSYSAYAEGRSDGARADFSATRTRKLS